MEYKIDFENNFKGITTLNDLGIKLLVRECGGEDAVINQINESYRLGFIERRTSDQCKSKIRDVLCDPKNRKYKTIKVRGVGLVPRELCLKTDFIPYSYRCWKHVLERCVNPIGRWIQFYEGCKVCDEWLDYSVFGLWYESQVGCDLKYDLDKDLLGNGKLYSPETCCLLPHVINIMITSKTKNKFDMPSGVSKRGNKYISLAQTGNNMVKRSSCYLGTFKTKEEAHNAYCLFKENRIRETAKSYYDKGELDEMAYKKLMEFKVV